MPIRTGMAETSNPAAAANVGSAAIGREAIVVAATRAGVVVIACTATDCATSGRRAPTPTPVSAESRAERRSRRFMRRRA